MENKEVILSALSELRIDNMKKQKKGLHFILASIVIWTAVLIIHASDLPILTKNLFTFCCSAPLVPLAFLLSKLLKIDFRSTSFALWLALSVEDLLCFFDCNSGRGVDVGNKFFYGSNCCIYVGYRGSIQSVFGGGK